MVVFDTIDITFEPDEIELPVSNGRSSMEGSTVRTLPPIPLPICPCRDGVEERLVGVDRGDRAGGEAGEVLNLGVLRKGEEVRPGLLCRTGTPRPQAAEGFIDVIEEFL